MDVNLVGGLEHGFYFSIYWECHHPKTPSFFRGVGQPPSNDIYSIYIYYINNGSVLYIYYVYV